MQPLMQPPTQPRLQPRTPPAAAPVAPVLPSRLVAALAALVLAACSSPPALRPLPAPPQRGQAADAQAGGMPADRSPSAASSATPPAGPCAPQGCAFGGRLSVRVDAPESASDPSALPASAFSARFDLAGTPDAGRLELATPLGSIVAQAAWEGDRASWADDRGHLREDSLEALTRQALGAPLPLASMFAWLSGQPDPQAPSQPLPSGAGFTQHGWQIDLQRHAEGLVAISREWPNRIAIRVRLDAPVAQPR